MPRRTEPIAHGTERGYSAHRKRGETACAECKAAHSRYNQSPHLKKPRVIPACGTEQRYHRHIRLNETPCSACKAAHTEASRKRAIRLPIKLFAALYWTADTEAMRLLDEHFGRDEVDALIKKAEEL